MAASELSPRVYEQLADLCAQRQEAGRRDIFLLLAADAALALGQTEVAEHYRRRLLQVSPQCLLKPYRSLAEALQSGDIQEYLADLRRQYPPEQAAQMLAGQPKAATLPTSSAPTVRLTGDSGHTGPSKTSGFDSPLAPPPSSPRPRPAKPAKENSPVPAPKEPDAIVHTPAPSSSLGLLLFLLVLLLGLGWLTFTFVWPFLHH